eukprot:CAMPEP_0119410104 /NCGR_PEP_ID=MMETSP1335-20130426/3218_1 /TAXON_ID=259385 /ORGANISM="Chrysoculter rhomboideus, Strain RCC1486" /LENGTH=92 /DNA_ID=CAMNT_0007434579 /DNA_START=1234 /DNA_END=1512 /DNA_ORIENTATION=+
MCCCVVVDAPIPSDSFMVMCQGLHHQRHPVQLCDNPFQEAWRQHQVHNDVGDRNDDCEYCSEQKWVKVMSNDIPHSSKGSGDDGHAAPRHHC